MLSPNRPYNSFFSSACLVVIIFSSVDKLEILSDNAWGRERESELVYERKIIAVGDEYL